MWLCSSLATANSNRASRLSAGPGQPDSFWGLWNQDKSFWWGSENTWTGWTRKGASTLASCDKPITESWSVKRKTKGKRLWAMRDRKPWAWGRYCDRKRKEWKQLTRSQQALASATFSGLSALATLYAFGFYDLLSLNEFVWVCLWLVTQRTLTRNNLLILILKTYVWRRQETGPKFHNWPVTGSPFMLGSFLYSGCSSKSFTFRPHKSNRNLLETLIFRRPFPL